MPLCAFPVFQQSVGGLRPCGQCRPCLIKRRREKTARVVLESKTHEHALYVTLTYKDDYLPTEIYDLKTGEILYSHPNGCLDRRAVQNFIKRVRRDRPSKSVRTFYCGEYGDKNWRPHYHFLIWGIPYSERKVIYDSWSDPQTGELRCSPDRLDIQVPRKDWDVGQYVSSYVMKKMTNPKDDRLEGRPPEFFGSSKGIGLGFVEKYAAAMDSSSGRSFIEFNGDIPRVIIIDGKRMPIDRYMRGKIINALKIEEVATETGFLRYQEEMQLLRERAKDNAEVPKAWLLDARRLGWALEKQAMSENAARVAQVEKRHEFFSSKKEKV